MKIFQNNSQKIKNVVVILGFFDGIHLGHRKVILSAVEYAKSNNLKTLLYTFNKSPAYYFDKNEEYIYPRKYNYKLIEDLGVDYLIENDFSNLINIKKDEFIKLLANEYSPKAIFSGFNYTFGNKREGNNEYLEIKSKEYGFEYYSIDPVISDNLLISSSMIKEFIKSGKIKEANNYLKSIFFLEGKVIQGKNLATSIGYPTANINYPDNIVKLPYGVYKAMYHKYNAVLNWGIKPTFQEIKPILELHILDFNENLYNKNIEFTIIEKIRDEKKFMNIDELKKQIKKDIDKCLKL